MKNSLEQYHSKKVKVTTTYEATYIGDCVVDCDYDTDELHLEIEQECIIQVVNPDEIKTIEII